MIASEEQREPSAYPNRVAGREMDVGRWVWMRALLPWLEGARTRRPEFSTDARVVRELCLAPVGVGQIEQRERRLDVPPVVLREEVEQRVAACREAAILLGGAVVQKS